MEQNNVARSRDKREPFLGRSRNKNEGSFKMKGSSFRDEVGLKKGIWRGNGDMESSFGEDAMKMG